MVKTSIAELRGLGEVELRSRLAQAQQDLEKARLKARQGSLEQPHQIRSTRRDIARFFTILNTKARSA